MSVCDDAGARRRERAVRPIQDGAEACEGNASADRRKKKGNREQSERGRLEKGRKDRAISKRPRVEKAESMPHGEGV